MTGRYTERVPDEDLRKIARAYEEGDYTLFESGKNGEIIEKTSQDFVWMIACRLHTEWCENAAFYQHNCYRGEAFSNWINEEAHYAYMREVREGRDGHDVYEDARKRVIQAIVAKAHALFSDWEASSHPPSTYNPSTRKYETEDRRNLRDKDLIDYMPPAKQAV